MNYLELSIENLEEENKKLYKIIQEDNYNYDLVIFIAKGAFLIGKDLSEYNKSKLIEVFATRKGNKFKNLFKLILKILPSCIKKNLRQLEIKSGIHKKKAERKVSFNENVWKKYENKNKILLVDDSVDTGNSINLTKNAIEKFFKDAEIKVAALNVFDEGLKNSHIDYYLYNNTMLSGPWSDDSKENKKYLQEYYKWHNNQQGE